MKNRRERGASMVEFVIAGIAGITLMISTIQMGMAMWNYHTLAEAIHETNRYAASHGRGCNSSGCNITVADIVAKLRAVAVGIPASNINLTLTSTTQSRTCNPITSCTSDTTQWPPNDNFDNGAGNYTTMTGKVVVKSVLINLWYGISGQRRDSIAMTSTSSVPIVF